jgi:transcriptional regulator with XRE-family HTH domain
MEDSVLSFGEWLEKELNLRGWTRVEFARRSGISRPHVGRLINDKRKPGPGTCAAIAKALDMPVEEVLRVAQDIEIGSEADNRVARLVHLATQLLDQDDIAELEDVAEAKLRRQRTRDWVARLQRDLESIPPGDTKAAGRIIEEYLTGLGGRRLR